MTDYLFYFLAAMLIWMSFVSLKGGIDYLRFFRSELAKPQSDFTPFATIIAPCKGIDDGLEANLLALVEQSYPAFEVLFLVDDEADSAVPTIRALIDGRENCRLVIAPLADACSQKVENLREAVLHVNGRSEVFAFVDSDVRPSRTWLRDLVAPLADNTIGAATGYRWFISKRMTLGSELRSVWNASIASFLGPNTDNNFCWGGSMAIRRAVFDEVGVRDKWLGTLSDDLALTRIIRAAGLPIIFVPKALTASVEDCTFNEMIEFTTRQMKIVRTYATRLWAMTFAGSGLFCIVMIWAFLIVLLSRQNSVLVIAALAVLILVSVLSIGKAWLRLKAARLVLTDHDAALRQQALTQNTLWLIAPFVFFVNCVAALFSRRMTWRGIKYELKSPTETVIIGR